MKRTKRSGLVFIVAAVGTVATIAAGSGFWFVVRHRESTPASAAIADAEFTQIRSRFAHQRPLIDMAIRQSVDIATPTAAATSLRTFHTVVFDTRGRERIVRISVPYWFARRYARHHGQFRWLGELTFLDDTEFDPEAIVVSLDQLERRGPGLVVDYRRPSGGQFISWVD
jgi:hypothetical protein